ncbi:MAG: ELM1/GtrOC1 family putative glycosyltransferase [Thermovirgaceae bacterium]
MSGRFSGPKVVFVLKDGIRGHENQSAGVARWLKRLVGADVFDIEIPRLSGLQRFVLYKVQARKLIKDSPEISFDWLGKAEALSLHGSVTRMIDSSGARNDEVLFLSAGSAGAPFCLSLARATGGKCACLMTPSVLGTVPFDFAIVPEHDFPEPSPNLLATLGAPNMIGAGLSETEERPLASRFPSKAEKKWGILIGGDDANYSIPPEWAENVLKALLETAKKTGADVFITTSRRTLPATEEKIAEMVKGSLHVRMLVLGSKDPWNPVPAMLGSCQRVFCTEDSVSMISEAMTGGHVVQILRVERKKGLRKCLQGLTAKMVDKNLLARQRLWGIPRFDLMIESFCSRGWAMEYDPAKLDQVSPARGRKNEGLSFSEARRAAEWIIQGWES